MQTDSFKSSIQPGLIKAGVFLIIFSGLHFLFDWLPLPVVAVFAGTNESFLQHAKIGFWAYSLTSAGECLLFRHRFTNLAGAIYARLLAIVLLPWIMFVLWYSGPALLGSLPSSAFELVYSIVITYGSAVALVFFERSWGRLTFSSSVRLLIILLFLLCILELSVFSFHLPQEDFFRDLS
jgi:hypothetical protein